MSKTSKWGKAKPTVEQPVVEETREEKINKIVEAEARIFDAEEEKFLNSSVEEIEKLPVDDLMTDEEVIAQEEFINEEPHADLTLPIEVPFIPVMITEAPKTKSFAQMTATEVNIYHKTGILPLL